MTCPKSIEKLYEQQHQPSKKGTASMSTELARKAREKIKRKFNVHVMPSDEELDAIIQSAIEKAVALALTREGKAVIRELDRSGARSEDTKRGAWWKLGVPDKSVGIERLNIDFLRRMNAELKANDDKGNWDDWNPCREELWGEIRHHFEKFTVAFNKDQSSQEEAADLANLCMKSFTIDAAMKREGK